VGLFSRLFGKKDSTGPAPPQPTSASAAPANQSPPASGPGPALEEENLRRWRESGQPRAWVEGRRGQWTHQDWLDLLESLSRSPYWPMQPDEVGRVLEDLKPQHGPAREPRDRT
jgi:hypothetical protein